MDTLPTITDLAAKVRLSLDEAWGHAVVWPVGKLEVRWYAQVRRLVTVGLSAFPQPVPSDRREWERIELVLEVSGAEVAGPTDARVQRLTELASLPAAGLRLLGGEPILVPDALRTHSDGAAALWLTPPADLADDACNVGRQPVRLGQVVALSELEADVADRQGGAVLADLRGRLPGPPWVWAPQRPCAVLALLLAPTLPGPAAGLTVSAAVLDDLPTAVRPVVASLLREGTLVPAVAVRLAPLVFALLDPRHGALLLAPTAREVQSVFSVLRLAPGRRLLGVVRHLNVPGGALVADLSARDGQISTPVQAALVDLMVSAEVDLEPLKAAIPAAIWDEAQRLGELRLVPLDAAVRRLNPWRSIFPGRPLEVPHPRPGTSGARQVVTWQDAPAAPQGMTRATRQRLMLLLALGLFLLLWYWTH